MAETSPANKLADLREIDALALAVASYERRHGVDADSIELRDRLDAVRAVVLRQVAGFVDTATSIRH